MPMRKIRGCMIKLCQNDKLSTRICIFYDAENSQIARPDNADRLAKFLMSALYSIQFRS